MKTNTLFYPIGFLTLLIFSGLFTSCKSSKGLGDTISNDAHIVVREWKKLINTSVTTATVNSLYTNDFVSKRTNFGGDASGSKSKLASNIESFKSQFTEISIIDFEATQKGNAIYIWFELFTKVNAAANPKYYEGYGILIMGSPNISGENIYLMGPTDDPSPGPPSRRN